MKSTLIFYHAVVYEVVFSVAAVVATSTTVLLTQAAAPGHKNVNGLKKKKCTAASGIFLMILPSFNQIHAVYGASFDSIIKSAGGFFKVTTWQFCRDSYVYY